MSGGDTKKTIDQAQSVPDGAHKVRAAIENAESPPGTMEWAGMIVHGYEPWISGTDADITRVYEPKYVEAAAIFSTEDGRRYQRLRTMLKSRGVNIGNWERRVRDAEHKIRDERKAEAKSTAQQQARARKVSSTAAAPVWTPLESKCQQPVDGKDLIRDLRNAIRKFVWLAEEQAIIVALWILFTWVFDKCAETNPFLRIVSPEPNCGKSTLLDVLERSTRAGWLISSSTKSNFIRKVQAGRITFLLDEADAFLQENEEFRSVLDAANRPNGLTGLSVKQANDWVSTDINVFVPIAIASIKKLRRMETVEQRSIHIWLKRATKAERRTLTKARQRTLKQTLEPIADRCARWAMDNAAQLVGKEPPLDFENGRDEDKWEPVVAIADYLDVRLGGVVRQIAADMIGETAADNQSLPILLLGDIRQLFDHKREQNDPNAEKYASQALSDDLGRMEDRPWGAMPSGKGKEPKPITQHRLASMLKDFGIRPHNIRIGADETPKGYERQDFEDAWQRYAADEAADNEVSDEGEKPPAVRSPNPDNDPSLNSESVIFGDPKRHNAITLGRERKSGIFQSATQDPCGGSKNGTFPHGENDCGGVADQNSRNARTEGRGRIW